MSVSSITRLIPLLVAVAVCAIAFAEEASIPAEAVPATLSRELPRVLLDTPINATLAANKLPEWRRRGIGGFLFQGLLDDLGPFPREQHGQPERWELLVEELRLAQGRLKEGGVGGNFLRMRLEPAAPFFVEQKEAGRASRRFTLAGEICREAGLTGLALEARPDNPVFDTRWKGYGEEVFEEELAAAAHQFAVRTVRAYIRAFPKGELLLLAGDLKEPNPIWFGFLSGVFEALGVASDIHVRLVVQLSSKELTPAGMDRLVRNVERMAAAQFNLENRSRWEKQGGLVIALEPIALEGPLPSARYSLDQFRMLRDRALLRSSRYCMAYAPQGGWWALPLDQVDQYAALRQGGPAKVRFSPPVPEPLDGFRFQTPFDDCRAAGRLPFEGNEADVLVNSRGAALLAWQGLQQPLAVPVRQSVVSVTNLITEERQDIIPKDNVARLSASAEPVLVEGLPVREYALPASFRFEIDPALRPGPQRANFLLGMGNPTDSKIVGLLKALTPAEFSIGAGAFPVKIEPGGRAEFGRVLQGIGDLGHSYEFTLSLMAPDLPPVSRTYTQHAQPTPAWQVFLSGPLPGPVAISLPGDVDQARIFYLSAGGGFGCADPDGKVLWKQHRPGRLTAGPAVIDTPVGPVVLLGDDGGKLHLVDMDGGVRGELALDAPLAEHGLAAHHFSPDEPGCFLALTETGKLTRLAQVGVPVWERETGLAAPRLAVTRDGNGWVCVVGTKAGENGKDKAEATALDATGKECWRKPLPAAPSCAPTAYLQAGDGRILSWLVGLDNGVIVEMTDPSGDPVARAILKGGAVKALSCFRDNGQPDQVIFAAANADGVAGFDRTGGQLWFTPLPGALQLLTLPEDKGLLAGTEEGCVIRLHPDGGLVWRDEHAWAAVTGLAAMKASRNRYAVFISSADGVLRAVDGGLLRQPQH